MSEPDVNEAVVAPGATGGIANPPTQATAQAPIARNLADLSMEELQAEIVVREMNIAAQRFNSLKTELENLKTKIADQGAR